MTSSHKSELTHDSNYQGTLGPTLRGGIGCDHPQWREKVAPPAAAAPRKDFMMEVVWHCIAFLVAATNTTLRPLLRFLNPHTHTLPPTPPTLVMILVTKPTWCSGASWSGEGDGRSSSSWRKHPTWLPSWARTWMCSNICCCLLKM